MKNSMIKRKISEYLYGNINLNKKALSLKKSFDEVSKELNQNIILEKKRGNINGTNSNK